MKNTPNKNHRNFSFPVRLNRYLYLKNYCSRRQADRYIEKGLVSVNGHIAKLGEKVEKNDTVELATEIENASESYVYLACYKPRGIVSHDPGPGEKGVFDAISLPEKWQSKNLTPLGRLDKASEGLLLLSDDGRIVNALLHPSNEHEKEYVVGVDKPIRGFHMKRMEEGVDIEGYTTKPAKATRETKQSFRLVLREGKKHQIRRMCAALGYQVKNLKRVRVDSIELKTLRPGEFREITGNEREAFLKNLL